MLWEAKILKCLLFCVYMLSTVAAIYVWNEVVGLGSGRVPPAVYRGRALVGDMGDELYIQGLNTVFCDTSA